MTPTDLPAFKHAFNRLAVAVRLPADQTDQAQQRVYWEALASFPIEAVVEAAAQLALSAHWFPKVVEWRDAAAQIRNQLAIASGAAPAAECACAVCSDSGWEVRQCSEGAICRRLTPHAPHSYVAPCSCRATNPVYQRATAERRERTRARVAAVEELRSVVRIP